MKFYNPFKPHIVKDDNQNYFIRCWFLGRLYMTYYGNFKYGKNTCTLSSSSYERVKECLDKYLLEKQNEEVYQKKAKIEKFVDDQVRRL